MNTKDPSAVACCLVAFIIEAHLDLSLRTKGICVSQDSRVVYRRINLNLRARPKEYGHNQRMAKSQLGTIPESISCSTQDCKDIMVPGVQEYVVYGVH